MDEFERGLSEAKSKLESFGKSASGISDGLSKAYSGIGDALKPAADGFKAVEGVGKQAGNAVMGGLKGFAAASTAVAGFGTAAVKSGMQFDATMSEVSAISGATGKDFDSLRSKALEMGAKTKFSASEAAEAMTYMGMAGWKAKDMIGGIEGIMNLAAASGEDLAITSDIVTDALTAFGLQASDSSHFANVMAVAATNANTDVGMMGETFKYVAPVAGALGYSVDDTAAAIGLMANSGIKASQAGTALRSIMTRLSTDAGASSKSLGALGVLTEKLGVEFYDAQGNARDLNSVLAESRAAWQGLNDEQAITFAKTIAGQEAMSGWLALMNAAPGDIDKITESLKKADEGIGAAGEMAATMIDNLQGDLTLLGSAFESLQIAISDSLTPTLHEFAQFGQKAMAQLLEGFQGSGVSGFMSALSSIVTQGVAMLAEKAPEFAKVSLQFVTALADGILAARSEIATAASTTFSMLIDGIGAWLSANSGELIGAGNQIIAVLFSAFTKAGSLISDNIGQFIPLIARAFIDYHDALFLVGIDILGAIGRGLVENKETIQDMASQAIGEMVWGLKENAPAIIEGGLALLEALVGAIEENLPLIIATGTEIVARLIAGISTASPGVQAIIGTAILPHILKIVDVVGGIGGAFNGIVGIFKNGFDLVGSIIGKISGLFSGLFALIAANPIAAAVVAVIAAFALLWTNCEEFRNFFIGLWEGLKSAVSSFVEWFKSAWNGIGEFFSNLWEGVKETFAALGDWISQKAGEIVDWFKEKWSGIKDFFSELWESLKEAFSAFGEWISEKAAEIVEWFKEKWNGLIEFFGELWDGIKEVFSGVAEFFGEIFAAAVEAISSAWSAVVEFFSGVWESIQGVFSTVAEVLGGLFQSAAEAVQAAWNAVVEFFAGVWQGIQEIFANVAEILGGFFQAAAEAVKNVWSTIIGFFQGVWEGIKNVFSTVAEVLGKFFSDAVEAVKKAWDGIKEFFSGIWEGIKEVFAEVADVLGGFFEAAAEAVQAAWDAVVSFFEGVWDGITSSVETVKDKIESAFQEARNRVEKVWDGIKGFFENVVIKNITSAFDGIKSKFSSIGKNIVTGIKNGITAAWGGLKKTIGGLVSGVVDFVKGLLGIASPSKVFAGIGKYMAEGLGVGWENEFGGIKRSIESGLNFGAASIGLSANTGTRYGAQAGQQGGFMGGNSYSFTFNSPEALDPVAASRKAKMAAQMMALGYV